MQANVPYTRAQYDSLVRSLRALEEVMELCEAGERCEQDMAFYRSTATEFRKQLQAFEREFMTPPPEK